MTTTTTKAIRNAASVIDLILKGESFEQIKPRIEISKEAASVGFWQAIGASQCALSLGSKTKSEQLDLLVDYLQNI